MGGISSHSEPQGGQEGPSTAKCSVGLCLVGVRWYASHSPPCMSPRIRAPHGHSLHTLIVPTGQQDLSSLNYLQLPFAQNVFPSQKIYISFQEI